MKLTRLPVFVVAIAFCTIAIGCVSTHPLNQAFYNADKVGIVFQIDSAGIAKNGSQGLLDVAFTPGNRFKEPLRKVETRLKVNDTLRNEISKVLSAKNKQFVVLSENIDFDALGKFKKPDTEKEYAKKDFRILKAKENVDELMLVKVRYGLLVSYYGVIETDKQGYVNISTEIVDLEDNSILQQERIQAVAKIKGNWKKGPEYGNLYKSIKDALNASVTQLKAKF